MTTNETKSGSCTFLIFDTETNGLPDQKIGDLNQIQLDKQPRLLQLAYQKHRSDGSFIERKNFLIKPVGFNITEESKRIHKIDQEYAENHGLPLREVLMIFKEDIENAKYVIGHGVTFDVVVVATEYQRVGIDVNWGFDSNVEERRVSRNPKFLTTKHPIVRRWWRSRTRKSLALGNLYAYFSQIPLERAHNAAVDASATAFCFFKLLTEIPELSKIYQLEGINLEEIIPYEIEDIETVIKESTL